MRFPLLIGVFLIIASSCEEDDNNAQGQGNITDPRDGEAYKTVVIGNQEWMAENLAYAPSSGNYWAYNNDDANVETYGYLYDWETACVVCPDGWHLPNEEEWKVLTDYLGGEEVAGGKLKETGTIEAGTGLWYEPNAAATNETGFTALPGGFRDEYGAFFHIGSEGLWWSATEHSTRTQTAWYRTLPNKYSRVVANDYTKDGGFSVRCVRD